MRFLLDENAEFRIADFLSTQGHDVKTIAIDFTQALQDAQVLNLAVAEQRILITNDRDFGELIFRLGLSHSGVIYFRLGLETTLQEKIIRLEQLLQTHADRLDQFLVLTARGVRARRTR